MTRNRNPLPPELEVGDPFEFWLRRANRAATRLGLANIPMGDALAVLRNALGDSWLRRVCETPAVGLPFKKHRLGDCLTVAGDDDIVEIAELSLYLRRLYDVPGLGDVLTVLRNDYWTARQQLAFAYRMRWIGANDLHFEPAVGQKRGDLAFKLDDRSLILESFYPRYGNGTPELVTLLFRRMSKVGEAIGALTPRKLRITVRLLQTIDARSAKELEGWILRLVRAGVATAGDGAGAAHDSTTSEVLANDRSEIATITVEDITDLARDPDHWGGNPLTVEPGILLVVYARSITRKDALRLRDGFLPESAGGRGTRLRIIDTQAAGPDPTPADVAITLVAKLQRKVSQLGELPVNTSRLLLVNVPWLDDPSDEQRALYATAILERIESQIVRGRSRMAGVFAVKRVWTGRRHQYRGVLLEGEAGAGLQRRISDGLNRLEGGSDLLGQW